MLVGDFGGLSSVDGRPVLKDRGRAGTEESRTGVSVSFPMVAHQLPFRVARDLTVDGIGKIEKLA